MIDSTPTVTTHRRMPAEWAPHAATWTAWPAAADLWLENLRPAQDEFTEMCRVIADVNENGVPREQLKILVMPGTDRKELDALEKLGAKFFGIPYGDIWVRDTGPIFTVVDNHCDPKFLMAEVFRFNGWGGKYKLRFDSSVSRSIASRFGAFGLRYHPWILEGGSIDVNGAGVALTTEQCLLNENRRRGLALEGVEKNLRIGLGIQHVLWIAEGLLHDHTDGHIDNIARFVSPDTVVCMRPSGRRDPQRIVLEQIRNQLLSFRLPDDRELKVVDIPSPGRILSRDGDVMPASYLNFYIANSTVVVPTYGAPQDKEAVARIGELFPTRRVVGVRANHLLTGGGSFHCITQQEPALGQ